LRITDNGVIHSEVKKVAIQIDPDFFFGMTNLGSHGVCFKGSMVDEWKVDYPSNDAKIMMWNDHADIGGRILASQMKVESRILHYIICCCLLSRCTNLVHANEEDIILM